MRSDRHPLWHQAFSVALLTALCCSQLQNSAIAQDASATKSSPTQFQISGGDTLELFISGLRYTEIFREKWPDLTRAIIATDSSDFVMAPLTIRVIDLPEEDDMITILKKLNPGLSFEEIEGIEHRLMISYERVVAIEHVGNLRRKQDNDDAATPHNNDMMGMLMEAHPPQPPQIAIEDLLAAIEMGLSFRKSLNPPEIRVHEETGILFLSGNQQDVNFVKEIIAKSTGKAMHHQPLFQQPAAIPLFQRPARNPQHSAGTLTPVPDN